MREVVAVPELPHDPAPPQLVQGGHHRVGVQVACLSEQVKGEVRAGRRGQAGQLAGGRGSLVKTLAQHPREITGRKGRPAGVGGAAGGLDDVQREAARGRVQQAGIGLRVARPGNRLRQARGVGRQQWAEGNLGEQSSGPHPDDPAGELTVIAEIFLAHGRGHQELGLVGHGQAEGDERHRLLVAPLHVVQHEQQRPSDGDQRPGQSLEESVTLPGIRHRPGAGAAASRWQKPGDFGAPDGVEGGRRRPDRVVSQPVRNGGQRQPSRRAEAPGGRHHRTLLPGRLGHLRHQAGLPHASGAADQDESTAARRRGLPHAVQRAEFSRPADERGRRQSGAAGPRAGGGRRPGRRVSLSHQALKHFARPEIRGDAELALEHRGAVVVGADGPGPVTQVRLQFHQPAIADLLQRLQLYPAPGGLHSTGQVTGSRPGGTEQIAQLHALALEL
jgi:hypothetical protein